MRTLSLLSIVFSLAVANASFGAYANGKGKWNHTAAAHCVELEVKNLLSGSEYSDLLVTELTWKKIIGSTWFVDLKLMRTVDGIEQKFTGRVVALELIDLPNYFDPKVGKTVFSKPEKGNAYCYLNTWFVDQSAIAFQVKDDRGKIIFYINGTGDTIGPACS